MALDLEQEAAWAAHRDACLARFKEAVAKGQAGSYGAGKRLILDIRNVSGDVVADIALKELRAATDRWKAKK